MELKVHASGMRGTVTPNLVPPVSCPPWALIESNSIPSRR